MVEYLSFIPSLCVFLSGKVVGVLVQTTFRQSL